MAVLQKKEKRGEIWLRLEAEESVSDEETGGGLASA